MSEQRTLDLFRRPDPSETIPENPAFWIEEVRLLKSFSPETNALIRKPITFQKGLNVIWAPAPPMNKRKNINFAGHAAGKTTFCRLLRYLLGEKYIAAPGVKEAIEANFHNGWIVGKIHISDQPWIIARPLHPATRPRARCIKSDSFDELLNNPEISLPIADFSAALEAATTAPLPVKLFGDGKTEVTFEHVIQWLTRDQECHLTKLNLFRHADSKSESPNLTAEAAYFLQRVMLNLADKDLQKAITKCEELEKEEKELPIDKEYQLRRERELNAFLQTARVIAPDMPNLTDLEIKPARDTAENLKNQATKNTRDAIQLAKEARLKKSTDLTALQVRLGAVEVNFTTAQTAVKDANTKISGLTGQEYTQAIAKENAARMPPPQHCRVDRNHAENIQCPAFLALDALAQNQEEIAAQIKKDKKENADQLVKCQANLETIGSTKKQIGLDIKSAEKSISSIDQKITDLNTKLTTIEKPFPIIAAKIDDLEEVLDKIKEIQKREAKLGDEVKAAKGLQEELQKRHKETEDFFIDEYAWTVAQIFGGEETETKCKFTREQISSSITYHGKDLTSAAVTALKNLTFDIAAMTFSCRGRGHHPRFLLHDSPREADMAEAPYGRIFDLIIEQAKEPPNFQHIITTTSHPPEEYQTLPYLRLKLDSSESKGRLFNQDL